MNRRNLNEHSSNQNVTTSTACPQDVTLTVLTDVVQYQEFADWLDVELQRLEARFADYSTIQSLGLPKGRHSHI